MELDAVLDVKGVVEGVGELMYRTSLFISLISFLLFLEENVGPEVAARVDEVADEVAVAVDVDVDGLAVDVEVVGLEDSQIAEHSFRLLDLLVFDPKSASVIPISRLWPYASSTPKENFSFPKLNFSFPKLLAGANDDICLGPVPWVKL